MNLDWRLGPGLLATLQDALTDEVRHARDTLAVLAEAEAIVRIASHARTDVPGLVLHAVENHGLYCSVPGKNGVARNPDTSIRILRFWGEHKDDNPSYAYHEKFAQ